MTEPAVQVRTEAVRQGFRFDRLSVPPLRRKRDCSNAQLRMRCGYAIPDPDQPADVASAVVHFSGLVEGSLVLGDDQIAHRVRDNLMSRAIAGEAGEHP